jgi:hypothetical protein
LLFMLANTYIAKVFQIASKSLCSLLSGGAESTSGVTSMAR